jgi:serine/threonine-protein kinase
MELNGIVGSKYQIIKIIKKGSNCEVALCLNLYLKNQWIIKFIPMKNQVKPQALTYLLSMENRGIPQIVDVIFADGGCYYIMTNFVGETLRACLLRDRISYRCMIQWMLGISSIVEYIHGMGLVHGDLKPENIIVLEDDSIGIIDYGSSFKSLDSQSYTLKYVAPERLLTTYKVDESSDIYSLGLVFDEMIKKTHFNYFRNMKLKRLVKKMLKINPQKRIKTAFLISDVLNNYI